MCLVLSHSVMLSCVLHYLAKAIVVPVMKNERCFAAAYGLYHALDDEVKAQCKQCRSPLTSNPTISEVNLNLDKKRHDIELKAAKQSAAAIVRSVKGKAKASHDFGLACRSLSQTLQVDVSCSLALCHALLQFD